MNSNLGPYKRKAEIRSALRRKRASIPSGLRAVWSGRIVDALRRRPEWAAARLPALTFPVGSEVDTSILLEERYRADAPYCLPFTHPSNELTFHRIVGPPFDLPRSERGIPEPDPDRDPRVDPGDIDLFVLPGIAFDPKGNRIGQGGGSFDRFLSGVDPSVPRIGLAFDVQIVESAPAEPHDQGVHFVITERATYRFEETWVNSESIDQTRAWAAEFASQAQPPTVIRLSGELGSGKTEWARGFIEALGWRGRVRSPSFTLENVYEFPSGVRVYHLDGYRLTSAHHLDLDRMEEILGDPGGVVLVEWPERFGTVLPPFSTRFDFEKTGECVRRIRRQVDETPHRLELAGRIETEVTF